MADFIAAIKDRSLQLARHARAWSACLLLAAMLAGVFAAGAQAQDITTGLVGHWTFDDASGSATAADSGSGGHAGTLTNMTPASDWASGHLDGALDFDGTNDYVRVNSPALPTGDFTWSAWVYNRAPGAFHTIMEGGDGELEFNIDSSDKLSLWFRSNLEITSNQSVPGNTWAHVVLRRNGGVVSVFVDGVADPNTHTDATALNFSTCPLLIGVDSDSGTCPPGVFNMFWNGLIDDVRVYNRGLSNADVAALYNTGSGGGGSGTCTDPAADEGVMRFDPAKKVLVFCDGTDWVQMGSKVAQTGTPVCGGVGVWKMQTTPDGSWRAITYGNGLFVAGGQGSAGSRIMSSPDGVVWTSRGNGFGGHWMDIVYANGKFVAVSWLGGVMTSTDGLTWVQQTGGAIGSGGWDGVAYGNGVYAAVGSQLSTRVMTSPDGVTWTAQSFPTGPSTMYGITFAEGKFVAVGLNTILSSADGVTWVQRLASSHQYQDVTYGNGKFVAIGGRLAVSEDGITWTESTVPPGPSNGWNDIIFGNGQFVAVAPTGSKRIAVSSDGTNWSVRSAPQDLVWDQVTYGNGQFVAVASSGTTQQAMISECDFMCENPEGAQGTLVYNDTHNVMQYCNGEVWVALGENEGTGVYTPGSGSPGDTTPDAFAFTDVTGAALSTVTTSANITIAGIDASTAVSVAGAGAEISINGGAWGTSGNITNGQTLEVRLLSSASNNTAVTATVTVGGVSDTWSVTTDAPPADTTPDGFTFTDVTGAALSTLTTATAVTISGIDASTPVSVTGAGAEISINGGAWGTSGNITNGQTLAVRLTSSASFSTAITATVNVGGVTDVWSVTTLTADTTPNAFSFTDQTNVALNTLRTSNTITIGGINSPASVSVSGTGSPQISIAGGGWATSGTISNGESIAVRLTSANAYSTARTATVNVGGVTTVWSVTTQAPPCGGYSYGGYCYYFSDYAGIGDSCTTVCASKGGCNLAGLQYVGSSGTNARCQAVLAALRPPSSSVTSSAGSGLGCHFDDFSGTGQRFTTNTTCAATGADAERICACNN